VQVGAPSKLRLGGVDAGIPIAFNRVRVADPQKATTAGPAAAPLKILME